MGEYNKCQAAIVAQWKVNDHFDSQTTVILSIGHAFRQRRHSSNH